MTETQSFIIDILSIVPDNTNCFIQSPSMENMELLDLLQPSDYNYYKKIILTKEIKRKLNSIFSLNNIESTIQSMEIQHNNLLIFQAYDGMEIGIISKQISIPDWFIDKYIKTGMCIISNDW